MNHYKNTLKFPSASPSLTCIHEETYQFEYIHLTQTQKTYLNKNDFLTLKETKSYFHAIDKNIIYCLIFIICKAFRNLSVKIYLVYSQGIFAGQMFLPQNQLTLHKWFNIKMIIMSLIIFNHFTHSFYSSFFMTVVS